MKQEDRERLVRVEEKVIWMADNIKTLGSRFARKWTEKAFIGLLIAIVGGVAVTAFGGG